MKLATQMLATALSISPAFAQPTMFSNPLAAPPPAQTTPATAVGATSGDRNIKVVESEGHGLTQLKARQAAVEAAIQDAVGVFIDSRRRSEMNLTDGKLHELVEEKIQTYSSAFVERVETISVTPDGQGGLVVKLRAFVSVPNLMQAMQEADLPIVRIDAASNQAKFGSQVQMKADATSVSHDRLTDLTKLIKPVLQPNSIVSALNETDNRLAVLQGQVAFYVVREAVAPYLQAFDSFKSIREVLPNSETPMGWQTDDLSPRAIGGGLSGLTVSICRVNTIGQADCHGEQVDRASLLDGFDGLDLVVEMRSGNDVVGTVSARLMFACVAPGGQSSAVAPGYLEAPSPEQGHHVNHPWEFEQTILHGSPNLRATVAQDPYRSPSGQFWRWAAVGLRDHPVVLGVDLVPLLSSPRSDPVSAQPTTDTIGPAARGVCLQRSSYQDLRIMIPNSPGPVMRTFYLAGSRDLISRIDGLQVSLAPHVNSRH